MTRDEFNAAAYDMTSRVAPFLDRHMVLPLLDFVQPLGLFPVADVQQARLDLLEKTRLVDFFNELHRELHGGSGDAREREPVVSMLDMQQAACGPLLELVADKQKVTELREKNELMPDHLRLQFSINEDHIEALYAYAKLTFDCGRYHDAAEYLYYYRILSRNEERCFHSLWGQLAADILLTHWDDALEGINQLSDAIDAMSGASPFMQLQYRTWLMHWGLFIFFNHENGRNALIEFFTRERFMNSIQICAPHLLRYLVTAVLLTRRRRSLLVDLSKSISQLEFAYSDPITQFVQCLLEKVDFDEALVRLEECKVVLQNDFFLLYIVDDFVDAAHMLFFEFYCRMHIRVDMKMVQDTLGLEERDAEHWIVNLIREAGLDATVDSCNQQINMSGPTKSIYESILGSTKALTFRTAQIITLVEKKYSTGGEV